MNDVIEFLEKMGQDPQLRQALPSDLGLALNTTGISPELRAALLARDQVQLETALGLKPLCVFYFPGKEDEEQDDENKDTPSPEPDEEPAQDKLGVVSPAV